MTIFNEYIRKFYIITPICLWWTIASKRLKSWWWHTKRCCSKLCCNWTTKLIWHSMLHRYHVRRRLHHICIYCWSIHIWSISYSCRCCSYEKYNVGIFIILSYILIFMYQIKIVILHRLLVLYQLVAYSYLVFHQVWEVDLYQEELY